MKSFAIAASALLFVLPALAVPTLLPIQKVAGPVKDNSYIIKLKAGADKRGHLGRLAQVLGSTDSHVAYDYDQVFNGYAGTLKGDALEFVRASKDVEYIVPDGIITIQDSKVSSAVAEDDRATVSDVGTTATGGEGVDIYGIDTGIYIAHNDFGGRARWGATFGGYASNDGNGHGTHTAATAVGTIYGVAPLANIIAVKVLSDGGSGSNSDVIAGINWSASSARSSGRPSVLSVGLGGGASQVVDDAVNAAINSGFHFVVAAGNSNVDAINTSPARVAGAITVGAVDANNAKTPSSNHGALIDIWAPGVNILSAWIGNPSASNRISGTSTAAAYVAGLVAVIISKYGNKSPDQIKWDLKNHARQVVTGVNSATTKGLATLW